MESSSIVILSGNHACNNPRAFKEAETLAMAGFEVHWLGGWLNSTLAERDRELVADRPWKFTPVVDWITNPRIAYQQKQRSRLRRWLGIQKFRWLGWENDAQLGYCSRELLAAARRIKADLYIAHSEPALWVVKQLHLAGCRVGVDMEDWFSEDLLPEARKQRPLNLLRRLEQTLLQNAAHSTCTSAALSDSLAREYDCRPPAVIYNAFPWSDRKTLDGKFKDRRNRDVPSIHWYSQTIGPGRGLEQLFAAVPNLEHACEIHLRGRPVQGYIESVTQRLPGVWRSRVFVHGLVSNEELLSRIAEHDIGFAGELKYCRNKDLTVSNKILHYLLAGLAVVASDTAGQKEVAANAGDAVAIYSAEDTTELSLRLNTWLGNPERLAQAKRAALHSAQQFYCWEKNVDRLLEAVTRAFN